MLCRYRRHFHRLRSRLCSISHPHRRLCPIFLVLARTPSRSRPQKRAARCWCDDNDATGSVRRCVFSTGTGGMLTIFSFRVWEFIFFRQRVGGWFDVIYNIFLILFFRTLFCFHFGWSERGWWKKGKILLSCVPGFSLCYKFFPSRLPLLLCIVDNINYRRRPPPLGKGIVWYGGSDEGKWIKELSLKTEKCCARTISMCEATGWGCYVEPMSHNIDWFLMMLSFNGESQEIL